MRKYVLMLIACAVLACSPMSARAEESPSFRGGEDHPMIGQGDVMGCGMMGRGAMRDGGMMGRGVAMRFIFALMDSDGDGTVSLQEFQAAHEKIFKAMDTDKDGTLTLEEIQAFMRGTGKSAPKEHGDE